MERHIYEQTVRHTTDGHTDTKFTSNPVLYMDHLQRTVTVL